MPTFRARPCACSCAWWSNACAHSPGAGTSARLGAVAFIHRFGSTLNAHLHFDCVVIDGVFDSDLAGGVIFRAATGLDANAIAAVQEHVRRRLLRTFVRHGLLPGDDAWAMGNGSMGTGFPWMACMSIELEEIFRYRSVIVHTQRSTTDIYLRDRKGGLAEAPSHGIADKR